MLRVPPSELKRVRKMKGSLGTIVILARTACDLFSALHPIESTRIASCLIVPYRLTLRIDFGDLVAQSSNSRPAFRNPLRIHRGVCRANTARRNLLLLLIGSGCFGFPSRAVFDLRRHQVNSQTMCRDRMRLESFKIGPTCWGNP